MLQSKLYTIPFLSFDTVQLWLQLLTDEGCGHHCAHTKERQLKISLVSGRKLSLLLNIQNSFHIVPSVQLASNNVVHNWRMDAGFCSWVSKDAALQREQHFIIWLAASQMRSGPENATEIWKLTLLDGCACPQMRGLIWKQECHCNSVVTADGTLEKTRAFIVHVDVNENSFRNSVEQICWLVLWCENGVFTDCNFSLALISLQQKNFCSTWLNTQKV